MLKVGDNVVYPNQGVCRIEEICLQAIGGSQEEFLRLRTLFTNSTVMVPTSNVETVGLRPLCGEEDVEKLVDMLAGSSCDDEPVDWKIRYKENAERMKSGDLFEVGGVLQKLHFLSLQKSLSFREQKMCDKAWQLLVSEIATIRGLPFADVQESIDKVLAGAWERGQQDASVAPS